MEVPKVEQWGIFEVSYKGPEKGNPFLDVEIMAEFTQKDRRLLIRGFYDGEGTYKIRFMPDNLGPWKYVIKSNIPELDGKSGLLECVDPSPENHGPVKVRDAYHFEYADGQPFLPVGTTCYAWIHQGEDLERKTIETLKKSPFNKLRMCVFPKHYVFNSNEPIYYPFEGNISDGWDYTRFNPKFFQHLEQRVMDLLNLSIQADIILFHPYDRWGYSKMGSETNERYLKYIVARLSAFRNVWWSLANEYDLMQSMTMDEWDRYFKIIVENDPYGHLRSIHNCRTLYDYSKPWVTHVSVQYQDLDLASKIKEWRKEFGKPIIVDECGYEGDIHRDWGNLPPEEVVRRFWVGYASVAYVTHGETYWNREEILWWSKGGTLHGESPRRIEFLRKIMESIPYYALKPIDFKTGRAVGCYTEDNRYFLIYFGINRPRFRILDFLPEGSQYNVDIIDTWNMTIEQLGERFVKGSKVDLPGKSYMALRIRRIEQ
ncbi:MAG: DUF5605 domain-containing protein [Nitrososphaerota archaeon]|nr:DUF5605 domain-containing protein [Candidatus Bathyarchaeota archaeon]MDW8048699.1 DUF5605 domain-containing protein [Nitrososphaerota archaeon]